MLQPSEPPRASRRRPTLAVLALPALALLAVLALGIYLGGHPEVLPPPVRDALTDSSEEERALDEALDRIHRAYVRETDRDDVVDGAISGAVGSLDDRFSTYFDPEDYREYLTSSSGELEGVGLTVVEHPRGLRVESVIPGSPARRAGIDPGTIVTTVDGRSLEGVESGEAVERIKGREGTRVRLGLLEGRRRFQETLVRERITVPSVASRVRRVGDRRFGVVALSSFTSGAHGEVGAAVRRLLDREDAEGIVLDLRGNGGGLLNEAVLVASVFLEDGEIVTTRGRARDEQVYTAIGDAIDPDVPVVVLVDRGSASASEIVAGALQDRDRGTLVGTRTFGKGVFQEIVELPNGGALDISVGEYFTPSGRNVGGGGPRQGRGLTPDVRAEDDVDTPRDEALRRALATLARER